MSFAPLFLDPQDEPGGRPHFPDPRLASEDGLLAFGGELSIERLLAAYSAGIFPWYEPGVVPLWWSPDPRGVLTAATLHVPKRLERTIRRVTSSSEFELTWNGAFLKVMVACGEDRADGTWIFDEMLAAYGELHRRGHAHSLEVWHRGELVGGTYGVQVGRLFAAESKFHRLTDMSKVALAALARTLFAAGVELIDVQFATDHLARFGVTECSRNDYLARIARLVDSSLDLRCLEPSV